MRSICWSQISEFAFRNDGAVEKRVRGTHPTGQVWRVAMKFLVDSKSLNGDAIGVRCLNTYSSWAFLGQITSTPWDAMGISLPADTCRYETIFCIELPCFSGVLKLPMAHPIPVPRPVVWHLVHLKKNIPAVCVCHSFPSFTFVELGELGMPNGLIVLWAWLIPRIGPASAHSEYAQVHLTIFSSRRQKSH